MNRHSGLKLLSVVTLMLIVTCPVAQGRPVGYRKEPSRQSSHWTVVDYFLRLPGRCVGELVTRSDRRAALAADSTICDVKHDYLLTPADGAQPMLNVVLFRHAGQVTVAVLNGGYDPPKPTLTFLRYDGKHWKNVTKQVLPPDAMSEPDDHERLTYQLPRYGTTIHVLNGVGVKEYDLAWHGGRFVQRRAHESRRRAKMRNIYAAL